MPFSCAAARPLAICVAYSTARARSEGFAGELRAQRVALQQLLDDIRRAVVLADVVDRGDVGVIQDAGGPRLLLEAAQASGVLRERRRQHLDRDLAAEPRILRAVDLAHAPGADRVEDLVGPELRPGHERHFAAGSVGSVICQMSAFSLMRTAKQRPPVRAQATSWKPPAAGRSRATWCSPDSRSATCKPRST